LPRDRGRFDPRAGSRAPEGVDVPLAYERERGPAFDPKGHRELAVAFHRPDRELTGKARAHDIAVAGFVLLPFTRRGVAILPLGFKNSI
jgi:hypothetical protein